MTGRDLFGSKQQIDEQIKKEQEEYEIEQFHQWLLGLLGEPKKYCDGKHIKSYRNFSRPSWQDYGDVVTAMTETKTEQQSISLFDKFWKYLCSFPLPHYYLIKIDRFFQALFEFWKQEVRK